MNTTVGLFLLVSISIHRVSSLKSLGNFRSRAKNGHSQDICQDTTLTNEPRGLSKTKNSAGASRLNFLTRKEESTSVKTNIYQTF